MAENELSSQDQAQLEQLSADLSAARVEKISIDDICTLWKRYGKYWPLLIKLVKKLPYGEAIARLLELIGTALDKHCNK